MSELNSFSTGGAPSESGSTPNFSSDLSPAPYTREGFVAPPSGAPDAAPTGRPSNGGIPGPMGESDSFDFAGLFSDAPWLNGINAPGQQPLQPEAPMQQAPQPQQQPQPQAAPQPAADPNAQPGAAPAQPAAPAAPQPRKLTQMDVDNLPAGMSMDTHIGTVSRNERGELQVTLNEEGQRIHDSLVQKELANFGYYLGHDDPKSPKPPIVPGKPFFNPFTGAWSDGWDPEAAFSSEV